MKFYISYFYQIRNMTPNMLPISTAMWDPKWFHDFQGHRHVFIDKNGVLNGFRMLSLVMPMYKWDQLIKKNESCESCGTNNGACGAWVSGMCPFMQEYAKSLRENNPDFQKFFAFCQGYLKYLNSRFGYKLDTIVFIVHEAPSRICGERPEIQRWFAENGIELKEWNKEEIE